jgi:small-conductance mechanosensitive channel
MLLLLLLVFAACVGVFLTRGAGRLGDSGNVSANPSLVDQSPLLTARKLAVLASTPEQKRLADETLRIADHEVDLAFADALRNATQHPVPPSPQTKQLAARLDESRQHLKADQDRGDQLKKKLASASDHDHDSIQQQLDLTQAQLELDQDEVDDAQQDLSRAGGDPRSRIQHLLDDHEAADHQTTVNNSSVVATVPDASAANLLSQFTAWRALRQNEDLLDAARRQSLTAASALSKAHDQLESRLEGEKVSNQELRQPGASHDSNTPLNGTDKEQSSIALTSLRRLSEDQKNLADLDKRVEDHQELAQGYASWIAIVAADRRIAMHGMIQSALWILLIVLLTYLISRAVEQFLVDATPEKRRLRTVRTIVRFAMQAVALLLILMVLFGTPNQTPTILGLAGAGLTVAMKDFIVAFFGWFVLMGRNGLRVGDWVEINGVVGEVSEIGLLRTVLFETGNWNDAGHPTGRKVAFVNSFAIEGHFFNFSTTGQWLWDELQVLVPANENPYPLIDAIQKLVTDETAAGARAAEEEWRRATNHQRLASVSAAPAINVRPTSSGVQVLVRYITGAHERYEMRSRLYQAIVDLLHRKRSTHVTVGSSGGK